MPGVGDQHKTSSITAANPFEETKPRMSEYTAQEIATLQSRLDKQLGPEYISSRPGALGQKVHYLAAEKVINLANEVFGFNGWSSAIQNIQIDFVDENAQTGKISLGLSVIVRVTLKDGTFHEDIGYGHIENCKGKAAAFEKAKKEGATDAMKRALRTFGNVLGNCLYDKDFLTKVTKIKLAPSKWNAEHLHRHADYTQVKSEVPHDEENLKSISGSGHTSLTEIDDEFGVADFDDVDFAESDTGHPDEMVLTEEPRPLQRQARVPNGPAVQNQQQAASATNLPGRAGVTTPSRPPQARVQMQAVMAPKTMQPPSGNNVSLQPRMQPPQHQAHQPSAAQGQQTAPSPANLNQQQNSVDVNQSAPGIPAQNFAAQPQSIPQPAAQMTSVPQHIPPHVPPVGFYSARAASVLNTENNNFPANPAPIPTFNPHAESPSIPKTAGFDHSKSVPLKRVRAGEPPVAVVGARETSQAPTVPTRDFVNPSADIHRRIGAPGGGMQSPTIKGGGMSGSAYRPLTRKPLDPNLVNHNGVHEQGPGGGRRAPLGDVSNMQKAPGNNVVDGNDPKRQRVAGPEHMLPG